MCMVGVVMKWLNAQTVRSEAEWFQEVGVGAGSCQPLKCGLAAISSGPGFKQNVSLAEHNTSISGSLKVNEYGSTERQ